MEKKIKLLIHGGAGSIPEERLKSHRAKYKDGLADALNIGYKLLESGASALEAVTMAIKSLEDSRYFNAGKGSVLNELERVEMDAMLMDGKSLKYGSILAVERIKNPIEACQFILEEDSLNTLVSNGAMEYAAKKGLILKNLGYFKTRYRIEQLKKIKDLGVGSDSSDIEGKMGTVGAVALDQGGNVASATSTGGMCNKIAGRVGDSGLLGAGTYANNNTLAISCTGDGEYISQEMVAIKIHYRMEFLGEPLAQACKNVMAELKDDSLGFIAIDRNGHSTMSFNTKIMMRGWMDKDSMELLI